MKKVIALVLLLALTVSMTGCSLLRFLNQFNIEPTLEPVIPTDGPVSTQKPTQPPEPFDDPAQTVGTEPYIDIFPGTHYDDSLIGESYSVEGSCEDEYGYSYEYSYHVPILLASTPAASEINTEINTAFGTLVAESLRSIEEGHGIGYLRIGWTAHWSNSTVFLVVECNTDWSFDDYGVYVYDFETESRIDNYEILDMFGVSEEDFLEAMTTAAGEEYLNQFGDLPEEYKDEFYWSQYRWTISPDNINMDLMMYLDSDGMLAVVTPIASIAGADWYYHIVYPYQMAD